MRDLALTDALRAVARDAGRRLDELVAAGHEVPYEVSEPAEGSALCQYEPLGDRFVRKHAARLRELKSFDLAREALRAADAAGPYLEAVGEVADPDPERRADQCLIHFLSRLWERCSDFEVADDRFADAVRDLEAGAMPGTGDLEVVAPLVGFQMPVDKLEMSGVTLIRADLVDVPDDARRGERPAGAPWEPVFLAVAAIPGAARTEGAERSRALAVVLERLIATLRLFKSGGVGLGPHAWVRSSSDRWSRVATGAGRPATAAYRLTTDELSDLRDLSTRLTSEPAHLARLSRAVARFEAGLERRSALDALNDHLLTLRYLLEGSGPAGVGMPMRVAALCAGSGEREEVKRTIERALALERELWSGEPASRRSHESPAEIAGEVESLARAVLRGAIEGRLDEDLRSAADEILLAEGLAVGEGSAAQQGGTTEWEAAPQSEAEAEATSHSEADGAPHSEADGAEPAHESTAAEIRPRIAASGTRAWLEEVGRQETLDFPPRPESLRELDRLSGGPEAVQERLGFLFPRAETEWEIAELDYDRRRHSAVA